MKNSKFLKLLFVAFACTFLFSCEDSTLDEIETNAVASRTQPDQPDNSTGNVSPFTTQQENYTRTNE